MKSFKLTKKMLEEREDNVIIGIDFITNGYWAIPFSSLNNIYNRQEALDLLNKYKLKESQFGTDLKTSCYANVIAQKIYTKGTRLVSYRQTTWLHKSDYKRGRVYRLYVSELGTLLWVDENYVSFFGFPLELWAKEDPLSPASYGFQALDYPEYVVMPVKVDTSTLDLKALNARPGLKPLTKFPARGRMFNLEED